MYKTFIIIAVALGMPVVTVGWQPFTSGFLVYFCTGSVLMCWHDLWHTYIDDDSDEI